MLVQLIPTNLSSLLSELNWRDLSTASPPFDNDSFRVLALALHFICGVLLVPLRGIMEGRSLDLNLCCSF